MNNNENKTSNEALADGALDAVAWGQGTRWAAPMTLMTCSDCDKSFFEWETRSSGGQLLLPRLRQTADVRR